MNVEDLVVKHAGWIRRQAFKYYSTTAEADDLASETICKALENQDKFNPRYNFITWVSAIMRNTFITEYNRKSCLLTDNYEEYNQSSFEMCVEAIFNAREILRTLKNLAKISVNIESLVYYAQGYSYQEISEMVNITIGTVKSRIANGRKLLRDALE